MQRTSFCGDEFIGFGEERGGEVFDFVLGGGEVGFCCEAEGAFVFEDGVEVGREGIGGGVVVRGLLGGLLGLADGLGMEELTGGGSLVCEDTNLGFELGDSGLSALGKLLKEVADVGTARGTCLF
ncbi:MAG: hypothetical protein Q9226_007578 [Calogaya cf. arnoldii]